MLESPNDVGAGVAATGRNSVISHQAPDVKIDEREQVKPLIIKAFLPVSRQLLLMHREIEPNLSQNGPDWQRLCD